MSVPSDQVAELQLLAARAEASVDASLADVKYTSIRTLHQSYGTIGPPFDMFAISLASQRFDGHYIAGKDIMFCRTPEIAKFIVALLNFGGAVVAECSGRSPAINSTGEGNFAPQVSKS